MRAERGEGGDSTVEGNGDSVCVQGPSHVGSRIRVLLVDDHKAMRDGLAGLLGFEPDIEVVGVATDGLEAVALAEALEPDVITMDVTMPGMSGLEATSIIAAKVPHARIIGLSMHFDYSVAAAMREAGAATYLTKGGPEEDLLAAIRGCRRA